ncbi:hypothetical protein [Vibrio atypicus]
MRLTSLCQAVGVTWADKEKPNWEKLGFVVLKAARDSEACY